ncbi:hypothetical protein Tco_0776911 [Tanacetum coccineum]
MILVLEAQIVMANPNSPNISDEENEDIPEEHVDIPEPNKVEDPYLDVVDCDGDDEEDLEEDLEEDPE